MMSRSTTPSPSRPSLICLIRNWEDRIMRQQVNFYFTRKHDDAFARRPYRTLSQDHHHHVAILHSIHPESSLAEICKG